MRTLAESDAEAVAVRKRADACRTEVRRGRVMKLRGMGGPGARGGRLRDFVDVRDDLLGELAGRELLAALDLAVDVVCDFLRADGLLDGVADELGGGGPAHVVEHDTARKDERARVHLVLAGVLRGAPVNGFGKEAAVTDVGAGGDAEPTDLCATGVGEVVAVEVRHREHVVLVGAGEDLLER